MLGEGQGTRYCGLGDLLKFRVIRTPQNPMSVIQAEPWCPCTS